MLLLQSIVGALGTLMAWRRMDSLVAGLILSSFGKLLHIVMVIWDYHEREFSYLINMTVFTSNLEAIAGIQEMGLLVVDRIAIFSLPYPRCAMILMVAVLGKYAFQSVVHHFDPLFPSSLL